MANRKERQRKRIEDAFVFRQADHIGAVDAAADATYLRDCFVDTGIAEILVDFEDHRQLLVGRTGAGKTALVDRLGQVRSGSGTTALSIPAEALALNHISNSTILTFVRQLGVNLDIFFKLLWRHVFAIEILKSHFKITDESKKRGLLQKLGGYLQNSNHRRAYDYVEKWGDGKFWLDTDNRIIELTKKLETDLTTSIEAKHPFGASTSAEWVKRATEEQKQEVATRAQEVINGVQMKELSWVIDLIADILDESGASFLILIDRLDETWVEEDVRYLLIRSLIETVRDFLKVSKCKIIVAIRRDLLERVFNKTRDKHFQEEKYQSLLLDIQWTRSQLREMIDSRIGKLVRKKYENAPATFADLFPRRINDQDCFEYMLERTLMRPRDMIHFVNLCISKAVGTLLVTKTMVLAAEADYSKDRLAFLFDEWRADYPDLKKFIYLLKNRPLAIGLSEISDAELEAVALELSEYETSSLATTALQLIEKGTGIDALRVELALALYRIGIVGLKPASYEKVQWLANGGRISRDDVSKSSRIYIHPMAWRALGTLGTDRGGSGAQRLEPIL